MQSDLAWIVDSNASPTWKEGNRASSDMHTIVYTTDPKTDQRHGGITVFLSVEKARRQWSGLVASAGPRGALCAVNLRVQTQIFGWWMTVGAWVYRPDDYTHTRKKPCSAQRHSVILPSIESTSRITAQSRCPGGDGSDFLSNLH